MNCCYSNCRRCPFVGSPEPTHAFGWRRELAPSRHVSEPATTWCERCQATVYVDGHECEGDQ